MRRSALIGKTLPELVKRSLGDREPPGWAVDHLYRAGGTVAASTPDGRTVLLECRGDEFESSQVFWRGLGGHQPESLLFWAFAREADVIVDVGAHLGIFSLLAVAANPRGRVIAVEPMPDVASRLLANAALNGADRIEVIAAAASSVDGVADLVYVPGVSAPSSSGLEEGFFDGVETTSLTVPTLRLDSLLSGLSRPAEKVDLVKIDVESHEPAVLAGMGSLLDSSPTLFIEVLARSGTAPAVEAATAGRGYRSYELRLEGPIETDRLGRNAGIRNYLLTTLGPERVQELWSRAHTAG